MPVLNEDEWGVSGGGGQPEVAVAINPKRIQHGGVFLG